MDVVNRIVPFMDPCGHKMAVLFTLHLIFRICGQVWLIFGELVLLANIPVTNCKYIFLIVSGGLDTFFEFWREHSASGSNNANSMIDNWWNCYDYCWWRTYLRDLFPQTFLEQFTSLKKGNAGDYLLCVNSIFNMVYEFLLKVEPEQVPTCFKIILHFSIPIQFHQLIRSHRHDCLTSISGAMTAFPLLRINCRIPIEPCPIG